MAFMCNCLGQYRLIQKSDLAEEKILHCSGLKHSFSCCTDEEMGGHGEVWRKDATAETVTSDHLNKRGAFPCISVLGILIFASRLEGTFHCVTLGSIFSS